MAEADYRLLTEATGQRIAAALENVSAMVGPPGEVSEAELTAKLADKADKSELMSYGFSVVNGILCQTYITA